MVCFDSTILIDILRGNKEAKKCIERYEEENEEIMISSVCAMELMKGASFVSNFQKEELGIRELINQFTELPFTHEIAFEAGKTDAELEKKGKMIQIEDIMVGVTAKVHGQILVTRNIKHLQRIRGLEVIGY
jgi:predicted nucleic acid-binding protein